VILIILLEIDIAPLETVRKLAVVPRIAPTDIFFSKGDSVKALDSGL